jgi:hypothetical protein
MYKKIFLSMIASTLLISSQSTINQSMADDETNNEAVPGKEHREIRYNGSVTFNDGSSLIRNEFGGGTRILVTGPKMIAGITVGVKNPTDADRLMKKDAEGLVALVTEVRARFPEVAIRLMIERETKGLWKVSGEGLTKEGNIIKFEGKSNLKVEKAKSTVAGFIVK